MTKIQQILLKGTQLPSYVSWNLRCFQHLLCNTVRVRSCTGMTFSSPTFQSGPELKLKTHIFKKRVLYDFYDLFLSNVHLCFGHFSIRGRLSLFWSSDDAARHDNGLSSHALLHGLFEGQGSLWCRCREVRWYTALPRQQLYPYL